MSNTSKEQTAAKLFEQILKEGNEGYPFRDVMDNLTDGEIIACVETYAAQQVALHSKQPHTEDKQPGETVSLEAVIELINEYPFFFKNDACRLTLTTQIRNLTGRE
jgi:hypothetical protein